MKMDMKEIVKLGFMLFLICTVSATLLAFTNGATIDKIMEQRAIASEKDRKAVLPEAERFEALDEAKLGELVAKYELLDELYIGYSGDDIVGYVIKTKPKSGYSGTLEIVSGLDKDGTLGGVRMSKNNQETPGLGAKAMEEPFYGQYTGKDALAGLTVVKSNPNENEILAISGATITSRAVTEGVNMATEVFKTLTE